MVTLQNPQMRRFQLMNLNLSGFVPTGYSESSVPLNNNIFWNNFLFEAG